MKETKIIDERIALTQYESEFEFLLQEYKNLNAKNVLEIGSYFGYSLHHWLYYSSENARVISVDLPISEFCGASDPRVPVQEHAINNEWKLWTRRNKNKLNLIQASSMLPSTKETVQQLLNGELLDFVFIDGDHRYEAVKSDFTMYYDLVKDGGIIALHDIGSAEEGGVSKLWEELKIIFNNNKTESLLHHPKGEKGIGILYK
jgi:predicted O-methyltransferase YrrM